QCRAYRSACRCVVSHLNISLTVWQKREARAMTIYPKITRSEGKHMEKEILRLINNHNGELSWYQLDRALSYQHQYVDDIHRLVDIVKDLEYKGLVRSEGEGPQPRYWITDAGKKLIAEQEAHIG